jgi:hypothetical protein
VHGVRSVRIGGRLLWSSPNGQLNASSGIGRKPQRTVGAQRPERFSSEVEAFPMLAMAMLRERIFGIYRDMIAKQPAGRVDHGPK